MSLDFRVSSSLAFAAVLSVGAMAAQVPVVNSGFEQIEKGKATGWRIDKKYMRCERGVGHNGGGGIVFESAEPVAQSTVAARQTIKLDPGRAYRFSALARTENFTAVKRGATMCVEWYDANGKWIAGGYGGGVKARTSDWQRIEGVTRDIPENAARMELLLFVSKGSCGKAYFDNVRVDTVDRPPVDFVVSSVYRDVAAEGVVRFHASLYRPDGTETKTYFSYVDASGQVQRVLATREVKDGATLEVAVNKLARGAQVVKAELVAGGNVLGAAELTFTRVTELPKRRVMIDSAKRCLVDGKPFFPHGMYCGRLNAEKMKRYKEAPFNAVMPYKRATREDLDLLHANGIMGFVSLREILGHERLTKQGLTTQEKVDAWYKAEIDKVKDHPALLGWYVNDESPATEIPVRMHLYRIFREQDAEHPTWAVLDRTYDLREFALTFDVLGMDPYPVAQKPLSHITDMMREVQHAMFHDRALWNVPQTFDWGWYRKHQRDKERFPTEQEMRNMMFQHVAHGANGLISYCFHALLEREHRHCPEADVEKYWRDVVTVAKDIDRFIPVFLADPIAFTLEGTAKYVPMRGWVKDGELWVLAVNACNEEQTTSLKLADPQNAWRLKAVTFGTAQVADGAAGALSVTLPAHGVTMLCFKKD